MRVRAPASAAAIIPWYLAGGAPTPTIVYQPKGAADLAAARVNLINPGTYNGVDLGTTPGWNATDGITVTAGKRGWDTGYAPANGVTHAMVIRYTNCGNYAYAAQTSAGNQLNIAPYRDANRAYYAGGTSRSVAGAQTSGIMAVVCGPINQSQGYLNGAADGAAFNANGPVFSGYTIYIGSYPPIYIQAVAIYATSTNHATWMPAVMAAAALI